MNRKQKKVEVEPLLEKFKPEKARLSKSSAKALVDYKGELTKEAIQWIQRWMEQLVRERSLPPQLSGKEAYSALLQFLESADALSVLERLRLEFASSHPLLKRQDPDDWESGLSDERAVRETLLFSQGR